MLADRVVSPSLGSRGLVADARGRAAKDLPARPVERDSTVVPAKASPTDPGDLPERTELIEKPRLVARHPHREDIALEDRRRDRNPGQLIDDLGEPLERGLSPERWAIRAGWGHPLPVGQEPGERGRVDRLDLVAKSSERPTTKRPQDVGIAPFPLDAVGPELATEQRSGRDQSFEGILDRPRGDPPAPGGFLGEKRAMGPRPPGKQPFERRSCRGQERIGNTGRRLDSQRVAVAGDILDRDPARLAADPDLDGPAAGVQLGEPAGSPGLVGHACSALGLGQVAQLPQEVVDLVDRRRPPFIGERLE